MSRIFLGMLSAAALFVTSANALPSSGRSQPPGITQPDEDSDADGLTNQEEAEILGANPNNPDTDGDGLQDGAEAFPTSAMLKYPRQPRVAAYAVIDLGSAVDHDTRVVDLNNNNQVLDASGRIWSQGAWGDPLYSGATRINDNGQILSYHSSGPVTKFYPERLNPDTGEYGVYGIEEHMWVHLDNTPVYSGVDNDDEGEVKDNAWSWKASFNNSGHVIGTTIIGTDYGTGAWRAFRWQGGEMEILPDFGIPSSETTVENQPLAINDNGAIAGIAHTDSPTTAYEGYLDQGGQRTLFGPYTPFGLNNSNHVLLSHFDDPSSAARLHLPGMGTQDLKVILGKGAGGAYSGAHRPLNNRGQMLLGLGGGWTLANNSRLFRADQLLPSGWSVFPVALNDSGLIAGTGISPSAEWRNVLLLPVDMAVDSNRDGVVKFAGNFNSAAVAGKPADSTTEAKPFRFWVNDDDDRDDEDHPGSEYQDRSNNVIDSARDLEDFARLHIHVGALQDLVVNGDIQVGLEWKGVTGTNAPSVRIFQAAENNGGDEYLKSVTTAQSQVLGTAATALGTLTNGGSFKFQASFWQADTLAGRPVLSPQNPNRYLIFEGASEGAGQLAITLWKGQQKIGEGPGVWLDLMDIRKMYVRAYGKPRGDSVPWQKPDEYNPYQEPVVTNADLDDVPFEPPMDESTDTIVFVHGIHGPGVFTEDQARDTYTCMASTVFKRLWQQGFKGRFGLYKWEAHHLTQFNESEYRAWKSGRGLAVFLASLPGENKNLLCYSQGAVVGSSAIRDYGATPNAMIVMQAAIPAVCYDSDPLLNRFPNTLPDTVTELGYRGYHGATGTRIVNFSDPTDNTTGDFWGASQNLKPEPRYGYDPSAPLGQRHTVAYLSQTGRFVTDLHESLSMIAHSQSRTIAHEPNAVGAISSSVPLDSLFGFNNEHGAAINRPIQNQLNGLYDEVLSQFGILFHP